MVWRIPFFILALAAAGQPPTDGAGPAAFEKLRGLAGEWRGPFEWTGARTDSGTMAADYVLSGGGSALVETLSIDGAPTMTSVYHLDGPDLRMTHFCAAHNQPRLKANRIDLARGELDFAIVDITNLAAPDAPHVEGLEIRLRDADHAELTFLFTGAGRQSRERISLTRIAKAPAKG